MRRKRSETAVALSTEPPLAACTIIFRNYLSHARILASSFRQHVRDGRFYLLVIDGLPKKARIEPYIHVLTVDDLNLPSFYEMCFKYDVTELSTAVKPSLLSLLLNGYGENKVIYFDPDNLIMRPLSALSALMQRASIVLTPHLLKPIPVDGMKPSEQDIMLSGAYNLGFIALTQSQETAAFLSWWEERLRDGCRIDPPKALFVDQRWIDLVPGYFSSTAILRDPAYNVAYWNLHGRKLSQHGKEFRVNGRPLVFFHFSGFDPNQPQSLSRHQTRFNVKKRSALRNLLSLYVDLQMKYGYEVSGKWIAGRLRFSNDITVHPLLRRVYLGLDETTRQSFGNLLNASRPDSFFQWAIRDRPDEKRLSPFLELLYSLRYDVASAFPDVHGRDRDKFLHWARTSGAKEMQYDPRLVSRTKSSSRNHALRKKSAAYDTSAQTSGVPRISAEEYSHLIARIREIVREILPRGSVVLVTSKGDARLVQLKPHKGWHFPQTSDGTYAGYYPADSSTALAHLKSLRSKGAQFLLFPASSIWWLTHYIGLRRYLERHYKIAFLQKDTCVIFDLRKRFARAPRSHARSTALKAIIAPVRPVQPRLGVNITGNIAAETGVGEGVRSDIRGLKAAKVRFVLNNTIDPLSANKDTTYKRFSDARPHPINLVHLNADQAWEFARQKSKEYFAGNYNIAYWAWELSHFPHQWLGSFQYFQEIWVPSTFTLDAVSRVSPIPVVRMPHSIREKPRAPNFARSHFGLARDKFIFLFMFDFRSFIERKNPIGLIRAFRKAFRSHDRVTLVLKCSNIGSNAGTLHREAKGANVHIISSLLTRREVDALLSVADCYVSLHRSEGFGLTLAEAMALGKPVIATGYSGNLDFMNQGNSFLVRYDLGTIQEDHGPYGKGSVWAEPDLDHAAELMQLVRYDRKLARDVGQRARRDVSQHLTPLIVGRRMRQRLMQILSYGGSPNVIK
jgi:glycosyltransferase involved in cell wall biosynthesis